MYPPFDPILVQIGPLAIRWYGLLIMGGVLAAALIASRYVESRGQDGGKVWDMLLWVLIPGLIGARLYYVFIQSPRGPGGIDRYLADPLEILRVWHGGLHIFGGAIVGAAALVIYARVNRLPLPIYLDGVALGLLAGQAIGRNANFINQELYGPPTTLPWGLRIDPQHRIAPYNDLLVYPESIRFHPLFLYEVLWNAAGFGLLLWISRCLRSRLRAGDLALLYLIWYPLGRFFLEFLRTDSWFFLGTPFNVVHIISAAVIVAAAALLYRRHRQPEPAAVAPDTNDTPGTSHEPETA